MEENISKYIIEEQIIAFQPSLAVKFGMTKAIILQHLHWRSRKSWHEWNDKKWVKTTYKQLQEQLPFIKESTIRKAIKELEKQGCLDIRHDNSGKYLDRTNYYRIDYMVVDELSTRLPSAKK